MGGAEDFSGKAEERAFSQRVAFRWDSFSALSVDVNNWQTVKPNTLCPSLFIGLGHSETTFSAFF